MGTNINIIYIDMKGFFILILFFVLLFLGPIGWICAAVLGIILLTKGKT